MTILSNYLSGNDRQLFKGGATALFLSFLGYQDSSAFTFVNAGEDNPSSVTHAHGYDGTGGNYTVTVGLSAFNAFTSPTFNADANQSVINALSILSGLNATTGNINPTGIAFDAFDFESVFLHEAGHALGLGHPNVASSTDPTIDQSATSTDGPDKIFDRATGADGLFGTADDDRGDDVNLVWFQSAGNDPFTNPGIIDGSTFTLDTPTEWPNVPTREIALSEFGLANTESVMIQGAEAGETQRRLAADDVAGFQFAMSGLDRTAGTADDYTVTLDFVGETLGPVDILITSDLVGSELASTTSSSTSIGASGDFQLNSGTTISFNPSINWEFNTEPVPEPSSILLLGSSFLLCLRRRRLQ